MNKYSDKEIQAEGENIFGDFDLSEAKVLADEYYIRAELAHIEMEKFFSTLPAWVSEENQFALFMMTDKEREDWLSLNSPFFQRTIGHAENAKTAKYGNIIVR